MFLKLLGVRSNWFIPINIWGMLIINRLLSGCIKPIRSSMIPRQERLMTSNSSIDSKLKRLATVDILRRLL